MRSFLAAMGAAMLLAGVAPAQSADNGTGNTDAKADARGSATKEPQSPVERAIGAPAETPPCPQGLPTTYETEPKSSVNCLPATPERPLAPSDAAETAPIETTR
jgi:hypothetical protein